MVRLFPRDKLSTHTWTGFDRARSTEPVAHERATNVDRRTGSPIVHTWGRLNVRNRHARVCAAFKERDDRSCRLQSSGETDSPPRTLLALFENSWRGRKYACE